MTEHVLIDEEARAMARDAKNAISMHEAVCAERWGSTKKILDEIKSILAWGCTALIGAMGALIGYLATHQPPH